MRNASPTCSCLAGLARVPFTWTLPPATAAAASTRVLKNRAAHSQRSRRTRSDADVFIPQLGMCADEIGHQADTGRILTHLECYTAGGQQLLFAPECAVLANHNARNSVQQNRA